MSCSQLLTSTSYHFVIALMKSMEQTHNKLFNHVLTSFYQADDNKFVITCCKRTARMIK